MFENELSSNFVEIVMGKGWITMCLDEKIQRNAVEGE